LYGPPRRTLLVSAAVIDDRLRRQRLARIKDANGRPWATRRNTAVRE
jgi:hypothetical protein